MDNMQMLIDRLEQATRARRATSGAASTPLSSAPPVPGLRFQAGDKVLDLATGAKGTVLAGARDDASGRQAYSVELTTGHFVYRSVSELERDTRPGANGPGR